MKKIAVLADSHGNYSALQAVLADAKQAGATGYLVLGDMVNRGPKPHDCTQALTALQPLAWVIGNHEEVYRSLLDHQFHDYEQNAKAIMAIVTSGFDRTQLTAEEFRWYATRPLQQEITVDGVKLSIFHATPTSCRGQFSAPTQPQENFDVLLADSTADLALYGHTHQPLLRPTTDGRLVLNPGSIGQAVGQDPRVSGGMAEYAMLTLDQGHFISWDQRNVPYDLAQETDWAADADLPYAALYTKLIQTGTFTYTKKRVAKQNAKHELFLKAQQLISADAW